MIANPIVIAMDKSVSYLAIEDTEFNVNSALLRSWLR